MSFLPFVLFFTDILCYSLCNEWIVFGLFTFFITTLVGKSAKRSLPLLIWSGTLLFLLDFIRFGRCGLIVPQLLLFYFLTLFLKRTLLSPPLSLLLINLVLFFSFEHFILIPALVGASNEVFLVTVMKIFVNLLIGCVILGGMQGNRFPIVITRGGRKVWTPNRKDAS